MTVKILRGNRFGLGKTENGAIWVRKIMGIGGMLLPFILVIGNNNTILDSISAYYYSSVKWIFVSFLVFFGVMLIIYKGYEDSNDDIASSIAGVAAFLVVIFPTSLVSPPDTSGIIHYISAVIFLVTLGLMSLLLFPDTTESRVRKFIYWICGAFMLISVISAFASVIIENPFLGNSTVFLLESAGIVFFGFSWLYKGTENN